MLYRPLYEEENPQGFAKTKSYEMRHCRKRSLEKSDYKKARDWPILIHTFVKKFPSRIQNSCVVFTSSWLLCFWEYSWWSWPIKGRARADWPSARTLSSALASTSAHLSNTQPASRLFVKLPSAFISPVKFVHYTGIHTYVIVSHT